MNTRHAVIYYPDGNPTIMWIDGRAFHTARIDEPHNLQDLADVVYTDFVTHLWVLPECGFFPL